LLQFIISYSGQDLNLKLPHLFLYEQVHPVDGFGILIQKQFESISSPLLSLKRFSTLPPQERRYVSRVGMNFSKLSARDVLPRVSI